MAMIEWSIEGKEFGTCNCVYGCPCQFNALPTHDFCGQIKLDMKDTHAQFCAINLGNNGIIEPAHA